MTTDYVHARVRAAGEQHRRLDPEMYSSIEHWLDKELNRAPYGSVGLDAIPVDHLPALRDLLAARTALYRALRMGIALPAGTPEYDGDVGNEKIAQAIDSCLSYVGDARELPPMKHWDEFWPNW